jgi:DNA-directed RNA polymerase specialized sigma24 family protein
MLAERKAIGQIRRENAAKRGRGRVLGESAIQGGDAAVSTAPGIAQIAGCEPDPHFAAEVADTLRHLMESLDDDRLRTLARENLAGFTQREMAARNGISIPTVQRKLKLIRETWKRAFPS